MVGFPSLQKLQSKLANFIEIREVIYQVREVIYPVVPRQIQKQLPGKKGRKQASNTPKVVWTLREEKPLVLHHPKPASSPPLPTFSQLPRFVRMFLFLEESFCFTIFLSSFFL